MARKTNTAPVEASETVEAAKPVVNETATELVTKFGTKSAAIRALNAEGKTRGEIAKMLGIRYQHVRNVLVTQLTKKTVEKAADPEVAA